MIAILTFKVETSEQEEFLREAERVKALLAERPGYLSGDVGRCTDEPTLWVLVSRWENVGSYRRALGNYDIKVGAVPFLSMALDQPSAFEVLERLP